jgi:diketogulonate reductase-like aldo/keto reductase
LSEQDIVIVGGAAIPKIGCGTWELRGDLCARIVSDALRIGFRHVDTAQGYENETAVGEGIRDSGIPRKQIFITTKVRPQVTAEGQLQKSVEESLRRLGTDNIDLLLVHWPNPHVSVAETMGAMSEVKRRGWTRHLGVSNFTIAKLNEAVRVSPEALVAAQIEYHPYLDQTRLLGEIRRHKLAITAYCPVALGKVARDPALVEIGKRYGKSAIQVTLRWLIQQGDVSAIPRTSRSEHLRENLAVFDFALRDEDVSRISRMTVPGSRIINEPQWVPHWD